MKYLLVIMGLFTAFEIVSAGIYDPFSQPSQSKQSSFLPNEKSPFQIQDGKALPLDFVGRGGEFPTRLAVLANLIDPKPRKAGNPDREAELKRIQELTKMPDHQTSPLIAAILAACYIRTGEFDKAINLLHPLSRGRSARFTVLMNLAHAHAMKGDWEAALQTHDIAVEYDAKDDLAAYSTDQLKWVTMVEKKYYKTWLSWNLKHPKLNPETEEPVPLFGQLKWVNNEGKYEPGKLADSEKAKLPADALAIVQQLLLWSPNNTNLYWLLAEVYAVEGKLRQAAVIIDQCANTHNYSNRKLMMAHREVLNLAVAKLPPEKTEEVSLAGIGSATPSPPPTETDNGLPPLRSVIIAAAIVVPIGILLLVFQIRAFLKRLKKS